MRLSPSTRERLCPKCKVSLPDFRVLWCERCGAVVLDDSANEALKEALRAEAGLLMPAEIPQNREALGLTRQQLAELLLRISLFTLTRWETGAQIQQRAMGILFLLFFQSAEAGRILGTPGGLGVNGLGVAGELTPLPVSGN
jgi:DNA-binding transcriptional regulator YiaG